MFRKKARSKETGFHTYKHIVIMDLNNLGRQHISSKFSGEKLIHFTFFS